jgi:hypothetical protein
VPGEGWLIRKNEDGDRSSRIPCECLTLSP